MNPLFLPPTMKACLLEYSYLLLYDLFSNTTPYVTVSLTLLLFYLYDIAHQLTYDWLLWSSVSYISVWWAFSISKYLTTCSAMHSCVTIFVIFFLNAFQGRFISPNRFVDCLPPPLLWAASQRPIGIWYCTIWILYSGGHQNDGWFAEEDEE